MLTKEYWEKRASENGHTGYADPFLYCFDQEARKFAIDTILTKANIFNKKNVLDFGCGSGDFLELLLRHCEHVTGYDIAENVIEVARKRVKHDCIRLTTKLQELSSYGPFDLVITVTVLQRLSKQELHHNIEWVSENMANNGLLLCMEFFSTDAENAIQNENNVTREEWIAVANSHHLKIIEAQSFYNPVLYPTASWKQYDKNIFLKIVKQVKRLKYIQLLLTHQARKILRKEKDVLAQSNDVFKIYLLQKL